MKFKHVHFIGLKGAAMTPLAILVSEMGAKVTGSDVDEVFPTDKVLAKYHLTPRVGFTKENLKGKPDLVVVTGAHGGSSNPEAQEAKKRGLKVLMHAQALGEISAEKKVIAVSGNHGKTTTAAIIAHLLTYAGLDPSFAVGCGDIFSLGTPGHAGLGDYFVVEADEYVTDPGLDPTPRFFWLKPDIAVLTNIDFDHPDVYDNLAEIKEAFLTFAQKIPPDGLLVAGIDDENVRKILPFFHKPVLTYGFSTLADYQISRLSFGPSLTFFNLKYKNTDLGKFTLKIPGQFNVLNAVAACIVANFLGISWEKIKEILPGFSGTKRRFELISEKKKIKFFDDYAHHPAQIKSTLAAAKAWFPGKRIICLFQPHTFSRTKALLSAFGRAFSGADEVVIVDIFPSAREKVDKTISSKILALEIKKNQKNVHYFAKLNEAGDFLAKILLPGDIMLTMGAGDVYKIYDDLISKI
ncbi:MAG: UDP-N-acetylmuramate--L-alanine ligase [Patescibacteria group bacterium]|nr:UDP-N-acetylmuramate--L-alanine ligase [Patescibacteria group bacterium]MCL5095120.1 UDP-N-acetylmuramate--L-alanine ligase [Patescibacteria group bacterium]